ncbi:MAG: hypothetical protein DCF22_21635, partial [Leptolyngbya sp.]
FSQSFVPYSFELPCHPLSISSDIYQPIALRIVIPVTSWQEKFETRPFMVKISSTPENGLDRDSAGNVLQVRSVSTERFVRQIGCIENGTAQRTISGSCDLR